MSGNIFNSKGVHVANLVGPEIFDLSGKKLYDLRGVNIYRPSGELVGHFSNTGGSEKRLDRSTDRLFPYRIPGTIGGSAQNNGSPSGGRRSTR